MQALCDYRVQGGAVYLTVGNRDIFFKERESASKDNGLPFDAVSRNFLHFNLGHRRLTAHHGDTVNKDDKAYLKWRRIIRSGLTQAFFRLIPVEKAKKMMSASEEKIKKTNQRFRIYFPEENWSAFIKTCQRHYAPDLLVVGHFHPEQPIVTQKESTTGIVVPSWHISQTYLLVDAHLAYRIVRFSENG